MRYREVVLTGLLMQRAGFGYSQIWEQITTFRAVVNLASTILHTPLQPLRVIFPRAAFLVFLARIGRTTASTPLDDGEFTKTSYALHEDFMGTL